MKRLTPVQFKKLVRKVCATDALHFKEGWHSPWFVDEKGDVEAIPHIHYKWVQVELYRSTSHVVVLRYFRGYIGVCIDGTVGFDKYINRKQVSHIEDALDLAIEIMAYSKDS